MMRASALLVSLAAGIASALLFAGTAAQTTGGLFLPLVAPLPIFIASLGWGSLAGFISVLIAAVVASAVTGSLYISIPLLAAVAVPAAWVGYLAGLARPFEGSAAADIGTESAAKTVALDWYPLPNILGAIVCSAIVGFLILLWVSGIHSDDFGVTMAQALIDAGVVSLQNQADVSEIAAVLMRALFFIQPAFLVCMLSVMLYLAARITWASGRFPRKRDDIPADAGLPTVALPAFAISLAISFIGGNVGIVASVIAGALAMAFALVGLAVMHRQTRGNGFRYLVLFSAYFAIVILTIPLFVFLVIGVIDVAKASRIKSS